MGSPSSGLVQRSWALLFEQPAPPFWFFWAILLGFFLGFAFYACGTDTSMQLPWPLGNGITYVQALRVISCDELGLGAALSRSGIPLQPAAACTVRGMSALACAFVMQRIKAIWAIP